MVFVLHITCLRLTCHFYLLICVMYSAVWCQEVKYIHEWKDFFCVGFVRSCEFFKFIALFQPLLLAIAVSGCNLLHSLSFCASLATLFKTHILCFSLPLAFHIDHLSLSLTILSFTTHISGISTHTHTHACTLTHHTHVNNLNELYIIISIFAEFIYWDTKFIIQYLNTCVQTMLLFLPDLGYTELHFQVTAKIPVKCM